MRYDYIAALMDYFAQETKVLLTVKRRFSGGNLPVWMIMKPDCRSATKGGKRPQPVIGRKMRIGGAEVANRSSGPLNAIASTLTGTVSAVSVVSALKSVTRIR